MRGSTRKRGSTWTAYWLVPAPGTSSGYRQRTQGGFRTQKLAQEHLRTVLGRVDGGIYTEPSKQPLAAYLTEWWLPAISRTVRPLTAQRYEAIIRSYVAGREIGGVPLRSLTADHVDVLQADLERGGLSLSTRRLVHAVLHRALADAVRKKKMAWNPVAGAERPSEPAGRAVAYSPRELRRFLEHVADDRLCALWRLAAMTGMRRGELLGLTWQNLELDRARLRVAQQLLPTPGGCTFGPPKSKRSERTIALDASTVAALKRHRDTQLLERDVAGGAYVDHDLVFCDEIGAPIHPQRLTEWFGKHRRAAGLPAGTLHVLRHSAATIALTADPPIPLHVVAARLGDSPKTLLGTYAHLLSHSDEQAAAAVAAAVAGNPIDNPLTSATADSVKAP